MNAPVENFAVPHFGEIPLSCVVPSKTNPRKRFDEADLADLAASIAKVGVAQPILCRPLPTTEEMIDCVEIVAGERRYRASKLAGKETIPAIVRNLTDVEVLEIQLIENLQRADVHPIEEAEGYERLMTEANYTADQLAEKVGKSRSYIYGRLKFCALAPAAREAFFDGKLSASTALLIARIPTETLQEHAAQEVISGDDPMSYREAAEYIQERYMLNLERARFSIKDAKLVKEAGSCEACPKRTGNQAILYPDLSADICTDPNCFASKSRAHDDKTLAKAQKKGIPVYEGEEAKEFLDETELVSPDTRVGDFERRIDPRDYYTRIEERLPVEQMPEPAAYVRVDGKVKPLYEPTVMQAALEKAGICETVEQVEERKQNQAPATPSGTKVTVLNPQPNLRAMVAELETKVRVAAYKQIREKAEGGMYAELLRTTMKSLLGLNGNYSDFSLPDGILEGVYDFDTSTDEAIAAYVDQADVAQLLLLLMDAVFGRAIDVSQYDIAADGSIDEDDNDYRSFKELADSAGIAVDKLRAELTPVPEKQEDEDPEQSASAATSKKQPARRKKKAADAENTEDDKPAIDPAAAWPFPTGVRP